MHSFRLHALSGKKYWTLRTHHLLEQKECFPDYIAGRMESNYA